MELAGISRYVSVPVAAGGVSVLVLRTSGLAGDPDQMGSFVLGPAGRVATSGTIALLAVWVTALGVLTAAG